MRRLNLGITCYPTFGGSGIVATQIGMQMADRGHRVHFICHDLPRRFDGRCHNVFFHRVEARDYPVFQHVPYSIALASAMVSVATREQLDILHVHYAVPHAVSAYLARAMMGAAAPRIVTTLHGTDITLIGSDPTYLPVTRFSIEQSDAVTTPSAFLRDETRRRLELPDQPIEVLPNFVDSARFAPRDTPAEAVLGPLFERPDGTCAVPAGAPTLVHLSNFRPVKRVIDVVSAFARITREQPCRLLMIGDGPERHRAEAEAHALGIANRVCFVGSQLDVAELLAACDVFLLPSASESFGLAALEAMSAGLPVVASDVGGLPEVVTDGETGVLTPVGDVAAIAAATLRLLADAPLRRAMGRAARERAKTCFAMPPGIDRYEALYERLITSR